MNYIQLYKKSQSLLEKVNLGLQTVFNGFWLGVSSYRTLHKIDEVYYNDAGIYCSVEYNKEGLRDWEREMVEKFFGDYHNLLLIGAGGGREVYGLQKMGYTVLAFECNPKLSDFGNQFLTEEGLTACINVLGRDESPKSIDKYDGIIIGWGAYMLIQGNSRRIAFLKNLRSLIKDDGKILLSFLTKTGVNGWGLRNTARIGNIFRFLLRRERLQIGDTLTPTYMHFFDEKELSDELNEADFKMLYYGKKPYGHAVAEAKSNAFSAQFADAVSNEFSQQAAGN